MWKYTVAHSLSREQIIEADIREIVERDIAGRWAKIGYCLGGVDENQPLYATPDEAYKAFKNNCNYENRN